MRSSWTCPRCRRRFVNINQWHSCTDLELDDILDRHGDDVVGIYRAVESALAQAGDFRIHPQKTRIAFTSRMSFASIVLAQRWADLAFIVPSAIDDLRIRRIELYGPTSFGHHVRLHDAAEVDHTVRGWLAEALRRGNQETLDSRATVEPAVGRPLEVLMVPLRAQVCRHAGALALRLPRYAAAAFDEHRHVDARVAGTHHAGRVTSTPDGHLLVFDHDELGDLGLGEGDKTDAFLTADL
jgi:hypothetical protein